MSFHKRLLIKYLILNLQMSVQNAETVRFCLLTQEYQLTTAEAVIAGSYNP